MSIKFNKSCPDKSDLALIEDCLLSDWIALSYLSNNLKSYTVTLLAITLKNIGEYHYCWS